MGKDSKPKESGGKGKGKQAASGSDENASKGKGKGGKGGDGLGTCTYVKGKKISPSTDTIVTMISSFHSLSQNDIDIFYGFLFLSARHILCEKQGKINEAYKKLQDGWLGNGDKVPPAEFAKVFFFGKCLVKEGQVESFLLGCVTMRSPMILNASLMIYNKTFSF